MRIEGWGLRFVVFWGEGGLQRGDGYGEGGFPAYPVSRGGGAAVES